jgi:hypothetical protein
MKFGIMQFAIIGLTIGAAIIHIMLAIPDNLIMFYLNGFGYIVLVVLLYLPRLNYNSQYLHSLHGCDHLGVGVHR